MLANRLKILLAERDLAIKDLMKATGLSRNSLSNMVNNPFANIATENIDKLCNFLDVSIGDFFDYFPWDFSFGYALNKDLSKIKKDSISTSVGHFVISAWSGSRSLSTVYNLRLNINSAHNKGGAGLALVLPDTESFDKLYREMSPLFKHSVKKKIESECCQFILEVNDVYNLRELLNTNKVPFFLKIDSKSGKFEAPFLFDEKLVFDTSKKELLEK